MWIKVRGKEAINTNLVQYMIRSTNYLYFHYSRDHYIEWQFIDSGSCEAVYNLILDYTNCKDIEM